MSHRRRSRVSVGLNAAWTLLSVGLLFASGCCGHQNRSTISGLGKPTAPLFAKQPTSNSTETGRKRLFTFSTTPRHQTAGTNRPVTTPRSELSQGESVAPPSTGLRELELAAEPNVPAVALTAPMIRPVSVPTASEPLNTLIASESRGHQLAQPVTERLLEEKDSTGPIPPQVDYPQHVVSTLPSARPTGRNFNQPQFDADITLRAVAVAPYQDVQGGQGLPIEIPPFRSAGKLLGPGELARDANAMAPSRSVTPSLAAQFPNAPTSRIVIQPLPEDPRQSTLRGVAAAATPIPSGNKVLQIAELPPRPHQAEGQTKPVSTEPITFSPLPRSEPDRDPTTSDPR